MVLVQGHTLKTTAMKQTAHSNEDLHRNSRDDEQGGFGWKTSGHLKMVVCLQSYSCDLEASQNVSVTEYQMCDRCAHASVSPCQLL